MPDIAPPSSTGMHTRSSHGVMTAVLIALVVLSFAGVAITFFLFSANVQAVRKDVTLIRQEVTALSEQVNGEGDRSEGSQKEPDDMQSQGTSAPEDTNRTYGAWGIEVPYPRALQGMMMTNTNGEERLRISLHEPQPLPDQDTRKYQMDITRSSPEELHSYQGAEPSLAATPYPNILQAYASCSDLNCEYHLYFVTLGERVFRIDVRAWDYEGSEMVTYGILRNIRSQ